MLLFYQQQHSTVVFVCFFYLLNFQALELLPSNTPIKDILTFLENVLENMASEKRQCRILRNLLYAENLKVSTVFTFAFVLGVF